MRIHEIFEDKAHCKVLEVLQHGNSGFSTREIIDLADIGTRSATLALDDLVKKGLLERKRSGNEVRYKLRVDSVYYNSVMTALKAFHDQFLIERAKNYNERAKLIPVAINQLIELSKAKKCE